MPLNGSGGVTQPTGSIYPTSASTLIESGKFNTSVADIYTILGSAIYKDGQQTTTAVVPFAQGVKTNSIVENTSNSGVTIDGLVIKDGGIADTNGNESIIIVTTASAVNEITVTNGATGSGVTLSATGDDTDVDLILASQGAGYVTADDDQFAIRGSADATKKVRFEVDGITAGTTRVITVPDSDIELANWSTGDVKLTFKTTADAGWVMADDGSIGSASSGATNRANADTEDLYTLLWNNISDTYAPVATGRGASASADFAANKALTIPAALGRALGLAGAGASLTSRALGESVGAETHTLTTTEMPAHTHTAPGHVFSAESPATTQAIWGAGLTTQGSYASDSSGSDGAHNNMQPTVFINAMIKL